MYYRGRASGGRGHRNMYYLTGLPGWMRGTGGGGPCAQFLLTGQWPTSQMQAAWQTVQGGQMPPQAAPADSKSQLAWLKTQAQMLQQQLEQVQSRISELEKEK
jgi:hypothetical protein